MKQWKIGSPVGPLFLVASAQGLSGLYWVRQSAPMIASLRARAPEAAWLKRAVAELQEYFAGTRREFSLPLNPEGTPFQQSVWRELQRIPFGETVTYGELARRVGRPKAVRAVGTANGKNPLSILVPCHRVVAANGKLGGYNGGAARKERLLKFEANWPL